MDYVGSTPRIRATYTNDDGVPTTPVSFTFTLYRPNGAVAQTWTIGQLTIVSTGVYQAPPFVVDVEGPWKFVAVGSEAGGIVKVSPPKEIKVSPT